MEALANQDKLDQFWELYPQLKQYIELFLIDYYKIFPHLKPEGNNKTDEKQEEGDNKEVETPASE